MKILATGNYDLTYNRTRILLTGLQKNPAIEVVEFPYTSKKNFDVQAFKEKASNTDFIYLPPFTHADVKFIRRLTQKPIVFDPLISKYLTKVFDYKQVWRYSPRALKNYFKDKIAFQNSDILISDTDQHKEYFSKKFGIAEEKIFTLPIGVNSTEFKPAEKSKYDDYFHVGFYGGFIPLQGVKSIVEAARILQAHADIKFELIGTGFEYKDMRKLVEQTYKLNNVAFREWVDFSQLSDMINQFDICLGIFGDTIKADLVIPNKVYHYAATKKCILTKDTKAIKELFTDNENIILTSSKPEAIAENILKIKADSQKRECIAEGAYKLISSQYNEDEIAKIFIHILEKHRS